MSQIAGGDITRKSVVQMLREAPAWAVSLGLHLVVLLSLMTVHLPKQLIVSTDIISLFEETDEETFEANLTDQIGDVSETLSSVASSAPQATMAGPTNPAPQKIEEELADVEVAVISDPLPAMNTQEMTAQVDATGGSSTEFTNGGTAGAIDRLTQELAASLREGKTMAIWLFDASPSLKARRDLIADRFENVYKQLDQLDVVKGDAALKTVVARFGKEFELLTKEPVSDVRTIVPIVRKIKTDDSGKENVFGAVKTLVQGFQKYRKQGAVKNIKLFIITDERGDDPQLLEETILLARRGGVSIYTIGNSAPFGRDQVVVPWKFDDGFMGTARFEAGPECIEPEILAIPYLGTRGDDLNQLASGYGPYGLTRLCKESGGLFFVAEETAKHKFSPAVMRNFQPDYRPVKDYMASRTKSPAKTALVEAAKKSKLDGLPDLQVVFRADNDNVFREQMAEAQKPATVFDFKLNQLYMILSPGEKDREKVKEPRWRAAYDLGMGRVLAMRVRFYGYNKLLAEMRGLPKPFAKKDSNEWRLVPSKEISAGQDVRKMEKQAAAYLKRVIDESPDTPWALLAERELSTPMGWSWQEGKGNYAALPNPNETPEQKKARIAQEAKKQQEQMKNSPPPRPTQDV